MLIFINCAVDHQWVAYWDARNDIPSAVIKSRTRSLLERKWYYARHGQWDCWCAFALQHKNHRNGNNYLSERLNDTPRFLASRQTRSNNREPEFQVRFKDMLHDRPVVRLVDWYTSKCRLLWRVSCSPGVYKRALLTRKIRKCHRTTFRKVE